MKKNLIILVIMLLICFITLTACSSHLDPESTSNKGDKTAMNTTGKNTASETTVDGGQTTAYGTEVTTAGTPVTAPVPDENAMYALFKDPNGELRAKALFFWNTDLSNMTTDNMREIVRGCYEICGYDGLAVLPYWLDGYLGEQYFTLYEAVLDEASKLGMHMLIYDEDGFPSYTAGGLFADKYPELTAKRIDKTEITDVGGRTITVNIPQGTFLGAVAMNTQTHEMIDISDKATIVKLPEFVESECPIGISASSTYAFEPGYEADKAIDGNRDTRWNAISGSSSNSYLVFNFNKKVTFDSFKIFEDKLKEVQRVKGFDLQFWNGTEWSTIASGNEITDVGVELKFDAVTAQYIRVLFRKVNGDSASISEISFYNGQNAVSVPDYVPLETNESGYTSSGDYSDSYSAEMAFDGDSTTRWNASERTSGNVWVAVNFGEAKKINKVILSEAYDRITSYEIQYYNNGTWTTCYNGTKIGTSLTATFNEITTSELRLYVKTTNGDIATLYEISPYYGDEPVTAQAPSAPKGSYLRYTLPQTGTWKVMAFTCVSQNCIGMDYLSEEAVAGYIDITYNAYYNRFKKYFDDGTIVGAFYDEPSFYPAGGLTAYGVDGSRMWTTDFNEVFKETYGDEINPVFCYPALWYDIGETTNESRDKLMAIRTNMFAENYIGQIDKWCRNHGITLTGHMLFEEVPNPVSMEGDLMYSFKFQEIPGVDLIGNYGFSQEAYKIISSSAYNWDKQLVMCEIFGAMGADTTEAEMYKCAMDVFAKGINYLVPHAVWYNAKDNVVYPPELSYRTSPYKNILPKFNDYAARVSSLLREGRHVADIAVLYPIDDLEAVYTFNGTNNNPSYGNYMNIGEYLSLTERKDFTYIHPEILDKCTVSNGTLKMNNEVNYENFKVVIIPAMETISLTNLQKIKEFYDNGGAVIFAGKLPTKATTTGDDEKVVKIICDIFGVNAVSEVKNGASASNDKGGKAFYIASFASLRTTLSEALHNYDVSISGNVRVTGGYFSYIHKIVEEKNVWFFANSSDTSISPVINLRGEFNNLQIWNPVTGERKAITATVKDGVTTVTPHLAKVTSLFIVEG